MCRVERLTRQTQPKNCLSHVGTIHLFYVFILRRMPVASTTNK
jgi:hypothetical protein